MMLKIRLILLFSLLASAYVFAEDNQLSPAVDSINNMLNRISKSKTDAQKLEINEQLVDYFTQYLKNEESKKQKYDGVKYLSVLKSDDNKLQVYTWNINFDDGSHRYYGFLKYKIKDDEYVIHSLEDKSNEMNADDRLFLMPSEWYGSLYYDIITKKSGSKTYYTLIGWDGADLFINRKVIDVLTFSRKGIAEFGKKAFRINKLYYPRMIFEYADAATMMLRYNKKQDIIVLDHLSPSEPIFEGKPQYYGPDFSFDAFMFKNGKWLLVEDIDPDRAVNFEKNRNVNTIKRKGATTDF